MDTFRYDTSGREILQLGRQGENRARELRIDVADLLREWPGAEITLLHQRPGDEEIYPVAAEIQETELIWRPTSADTALAGRGLAEVRATLDGVLTKSVMLRTKIVASLTGHETETPEPSKDWVDKVIQATQNPPVKDVQVAGTSVLADGVANVPLASETVNGVMRPDFYGLSVNQNGVLYAPNASNAKVVNRSSNATLTAYNLDYAVKAAMCDGKGAAWTSAEQQAARSRMGLDKPYEPIEEIVLDEAADVLRSSEPDGTPYHLRAILVEFISPGASSDTAISQFVYVGSEFLYNYGVKAIGANAGAKSALHAEIAGGMLRLEQVFIRPKSGSNDEANTPRAGYKVMSGDAITQIWLSTMPSGTTIKIYGVRA